MVNYIYPQRAIKELNPSNLRSNTSTIHTNVLKYDQTLMQLHESNPVPEMSSHKMLKLQFNDNYPSTKRNTIQDISQTIHNRSANKVVSFVHSEEPITSFQ